MHGLLPRLLLVSNQTCVKEPDQSAEYLLTAVSVLAAASEAQERAHIQIISDVGDAHHHFCVPHMRNQVVPAWHGASEACVVRARNPHVLMAS